MYGLSWSVSCCSRHIVNSVSHPLNPTGEKNMTQDIWLFNKREPRWRCGGLDLDCELGVWVQRIGCNLLGLWALEQPGYMGVDTRLQSQGVNCRCLKEHMLLKSRWVERVLFIHGRGNEVKLFCPTEMGCDHSRVFETLLPWLGLLRMFWLQIRVLKRKLVN